MISSFLQPEVLPYASVTIVRASVPMTTALNDEVVVVDGLVRVCAWCVPPIRLREIHRTHRCSDGMCPACSAQLEQESGS